MTNIIIFINIFIVIIIISIIIIITIIIMSSQKLYGDTIYLYIAT